MNNLSDNIISAFLDKQVYVLKDVELCSAIANQGVSCTVNDIRRQVQQLSPALFQVIFSNDGTATIRVDPKIEVCSDFLNNRCRSEAKTCDKLHICRHFEGGCPSPNCSFPHDFTRGYNRKIIAENHCQSINPILLVKLLRRRKFSSSRIPHTRGSRGGGGGRGRNRGRGGRGRGHGLANQISSNTFSTRKDDPNRQVDVIFPSSNLAEQIDMEMIEMLLNLQDIKVENKFNEDENEHFRRRTIQLEHLADVDKILASPTIHHHGIDIKFKRTSSIIDKTSFLLKTTINNTDDKINEGRIKLYISTLIGNGIENKNSDLSSDSEQIILVQCYSDIDFVKIRQAHESRPSLSGKQITLTQIYECDTVEVRHNAENEPVTHTDLKFIFKSVWDRIFAFNFSTQDYAEVEFINAEAFKQWMVNHEQIQSQNDITINPIIDGVDENNDTKSNSIQAVPSNIDTCSVTSTISNDEPHQTTIKLNPDWTLIASQPKFQAEYKTFIRNQFGGEINVRGDQAIYHGTFPRHTQGLSNKIILVNKTTEFMQQFKSDKLFKLDQRQVDILQQKSAILAYNRINETDYVVATKPNDMKELKRQLFHPTNQRSESGQIPPLMTFQTNKRSPSISSLNSDTNERFHSPPMMSTNVFNSMYPITVPEQIIMFSIDRFENRLQQYLQMTFNVKTIFERNNLNEKTKGTKPCILIKMTGQMNDVQNATQELINLFSAVHKKTFEDKNDGNWTRSEEAIQVIQHHLKLADLICICEQKPPNIVNVYFFDITNPQFGIDEQQIDDLIKDKFQSATLNYNKQSISTKFTKDWTDLEDKLRKRHDYKKNICFYKESNMMYLFGLPELVKEFREKFEQLKNTHEPQSCKINLSERQLNYLTFVVKAEMTKLEKQFKSDGCDISVARLRHQREFLAPLEMHSKIKDSLEALAQIRDITFEINEPGFDVLVSKEPERLMNIVKSKCWLEKTIDTYRDYISPPKARISDVEDRIKQTQTASAPSNVTSVTMNHSTVTISIGDLTTQNVDAIVACSTSEYLCKAITDKAGAQVQKEYGLLKLSGAFPGTTSGGTLPCKRILFIPWSPDSRDENSIKSSLNTFIELAFAQANVDGCKSIAFPAVGCGKFNFDPLLIAKYMLDETRKQIKIQKSKMNILFILLADQQIVYDAFVKHLNQMVTIDLTVNQKIPTKQKDDHQTIGYDKKIVKIILISTNENHLMKCKQEIIALAQTYSIKSKLTNKQDMLDWSQETIYKYYEFCLKQRVIPTLDLANVTLELVGTKDAVHEAEKYFYELTSETLKQERIQAVSRGVVWSVELIPNSNTWEQYSFKLNGIIEDAYLKKHLNVDFTNDKEEKCRIIFATEEEHHGLNTRRIRRNLLNSTLPSTWEPSDQNCKRVILSPTTSEYQNVLAQFHVTMLGKYSQIVKIERVQNERWYKQYDAHRDDFKRRYPKLDERQLFHGCSPTAADQIIRECFNRSFAGAHGIVYGCGVYFHAQASYSHQYAQVNNPGDKTMFLARVLIGKTCKGDSKMKVPPAGHDTTTDGEHIFVVYHDAGVYADHLITYR
ncbi:unnamed protein product [Adineta steineri]|uniref:Poly [ADP-ribose] polymerase n=1 Tax=Adineta steineri TaxID=433720 RepID=A0A819GNB0_9BILA|nr:unnamed protein product [Adineta steineri]CAF3886908.1 unnamed protein product [Adineta steineri]